MIAAKGGHVETVVALIRYGADVNLKDWVSCWRENLPLFTMGCSSCLN